jgi:hypothetical protein
MKIRSAAALAVLVSCTLCLPSIAAAIVFGVQANGGVPGSPVEVQFYLRDSRGLVAGVQADVAWDANCLSVASGGDQTAACYGNSAIPKNVSTRLRGPAFMRAIYFSLSDVEPIAQDTWLFTCVFTIAPSTTATQCPITLSNPILSDSKGGRLPVSAHNGVVPIAQPVVPTPTTGTAVPSGAGSAAAPATGEGCALQAGQPGASGLVWLLFIPALVLRRRWRR